MQSTEVGLINTAVCFWLVPFLFTSSYFHCNLLAVSLHLLGKGTLNTLKIISKYLYYAYNTYCLMKLDRWKEETTAS